MTPARGMFSARLLVDTDALCEDRNVFPGMARGRAYEPQVAVLGFMVIPTGAEPGRAKRWREARDSWVGT